MMFFPGLLLYIICLILAISLKNLLKISWHTFTGRYNYIFVSTPYLNSVCRRCALFSNYSRPI